MINKVIILGRVGSDPEVKVSAREEKFAGMSVATSEKYKSKQGEWQEKTQWHRVVCWDPNVAATIEKFVRKGTTVYLEGQVETRSYDQQGETKYVTEIVLPKFKGVLKMIGGSSGQTTKTSASSETKEDIPF
tara:strand:+ start:502 stop:897 length:396 start_codon:yes stop_codon:yes gene_type:complete